MIYIIHVYDIFVPYILLEYTMLRDRGREVRTRCGTIKSTIELEQPESEVLHTVITQYWSKSSRNGSCRILTDREGDY